MASPAQRQLDEIIKRAEKEAIKLKEEREKKEKIRKEMLKKQQLIQKNARESKVNANRKTEIDKLNAQQLQKYNQRRGWVEAAIFRNERKLDRTDPARIQRIKQMNQLVALNFEQVQKNNRLNRDINNKIYDQYMKRHQYGSNIANNIYGETFITFIRKYIAPIINLEKNYKELDFEADEELKRAINIYIEFILKICEQTTEERKNTKLYLNDFSFLKYILDNRRIYYDYDSASPDSIIDGNISPEAPDLTNPDQAFRVRPRSADVRQQPNFSLTLDSGRVPQVPPAEVPPAEVPPAEVPPAEIQ